MADTHAKAILLLSCPDQKGLVSRITHFIFERGGNILDLHEHVDPEERTFSIRVAWDMADFRVDAEDTKLAFAQLAKEFRAVWDIRFAEKRPSYAIFVSRYDHCLQELLWRHSLGEFNAHIPLILSNHPDLEPLARQHGIAFHYFPVTPENKEAQERSELALLEEHAIDTVVLARYMQILSPAFVAAYPNRIINIHHSFLPAFAGGNPYRQAYERGVKIIGATSHYVTDRLDEGPIIEQDIVRITHRDSLADLKRKGRDLERLVLARAVQLHAEHRILAYRNKTMIFT